MSNAIWGGQWSTGKGFSPNPAVLSCQLQAHRYSMFISLKGDREGHKAPQSQTFCASTTRIKI